ncbi:MAG: hypothetical protein ACO4CH_08710 [Saprospiraceae bacterium]|jgi:chromosome segregation ATPase
MTTSHDAGQLHIDHTLWNKELNFYADELAVFENRLSDLVQKDRNAEMLAKLEHFQNQFIRQKEVLDELSHEIGLHEQKMARLLKNNQSLTDDLRAHHDQVAERMGDYRRIYSDLKTEFQRYLVKWI